MPPVRHRNGYGPVPCGQAKENHPQHKGIYPIGQYSLHNISQKAVIDQIE